MADRRANGLVITSHDQIHIPGIGGQIRTGQRRNRVEQKQGAMLMCQARHFSRFVERAGRRFVVHHGDQFIGAARQLLLKCLQVDWRSPRHGQPIGFAAHGTGDTNRRLPKHAVDNR
jgi:hypothetical protein